MNILTILLHAGVTKTTKKYKHNYKNTSRTPQAPQVSTSQEMSGLSRSDSRKISCWRHKSMARWRWKKFFLKENKPVPCTSFQRLRNSCFAWEINLKPVSRRLYAPRARSNFPSFLYRRQLRRFSETSFSFIRCEIFMAVSPDSGFAVSNMCICVPVSFLNVDCVLRCIRCICILIERRISAPIDIIRFNA